MAIWIPGANGLVARALQARLQQEGRPFWATGREVDIADLAACRAFVAAHPICHILNCAAYSQVDPAEQEREKAYRANALGPETLGRVAKEAGLTLLHLSTDYVFSGAGRAPLKETDPVAPCNYYGETKLEGEQRLQAVFPAACILRTSWIFGTGGKNFVAKLWELLQTQEELRLVSDQTGRPTYAPDLVEVMLRMLSHSGLYQFANAGPTNKYEFALALKEEMEKRGQPVRCRSILAVESSAFSSPAKRPLYSAFDTTKIEQALQIQPRTWRQALKEYAHAAAR